MTTPTKECGKPAAATMRSMIGDSTLASPTTATSATSSNPRLITADLPLGGSAWLSSTAPACATGRKEVAMPHGLGEDELRTANLFPRNMIAFQRDVARYSYYPLPDTGHWSPQ